MPAIELNIGHLPKPRREREDGDDAPFRVVVLGDFSGQPRERRQPLAERRPVRIDIDNFDRVFARIAPVAEIDGLQDEAGGALRIALESMDAFSADALLARLPARASASASPPPAPAREDGAEDA